MQVMKMDLRLGKFADLLIHVLNHDKEFNYMSYVAYETKITFPHVCKLVEEMKKRTK